jgi:hypothetical protein
VILPHVRLAGPGDEEKLFDFLMDFNKDNNTFGFDVDTACIKEHISEATEHRGGICGIVDGNDNTIAGAVNLIHRYAYFSSKYHLEETFLYVRSEYRKSRIADSLMVWTKLVRKMIEDTEDRPVILMTSVTSENRLAAKSRWWRKHCGKEVGLIYFIR